MSRPALAPDPEPCRGFYGKLPAAGDFVRRGLAPPVSRRLQDWLQDGLGRFAGRDPEARDTLFSAAPVWRFAVGEGLICDAPVVGVLAPSRDKVGRIFPVVAVASLDEGPADDPKAYDPWLSDLEAVVCEATGGGRDADALASAIQALGAPANAAKPAPATPGSLWWRGGKRRTKPLRFAGLPSDAEFESLFESTAKPPRPRPARRGALAKGGS